jgi:FAD/FMN-containing dehydrogenase
VIARCAAAADVRVGIERGRSRDLPLAVRGGGHNVAGTASRDGGVVIDLSPMKDVRVDPAGGSAWAQAGLLWGELDQATQLPVPPPPGGAAGAGRAVLYPAEHAAQVCAATATGRPAPPTR